MEFSRKARRLSVGMCVVAVLLPACERTSPSPEPKTTGARLPSAAAVVGGAEFSALAGRVYLGYLERHPGHAVELGLHAYDGRLSDLSAAGILRTVSRSREELAQLAAVDPASLTPTEHLERDVLMRALRQDLFELDELELWRKSPLFYGQGLELTPYVARDYAPLAERARAIIRVAQATPARLAQAQANLRPALPRTWLDVALLQAKGFMAFAKDDVGEAMRGLADPALAAELDAALGQMTGALSAWVAFLQARQNTANDDFALGAEKFLRMVDETQGISVDLATLEKLAQEDLDRNLEAIAQAARQIDATKSTKDVVAAVLAEKPAPDRVLAVAAEQAEAMRKLLIDKNLVTISSIVPGTLEGSRPPRDRLRRAEPGSRPRDIDVPGTLEGSRTPGDRLGRASLGSRPRDIDDRAEVRESPPFMRWNSAFLNAAGVFEARALPSFYYISPPDPKWPKARQAEYVPGTVDLLFTTVHEVWPGHFLHHLHIKKNPSKILKSFWNYSMGEGWAHYAEEMMYDEGAGAHDPKAHIGQLTNALLRNVRFVSALGLHTRGMTVEQSTERFVEQAFADVTNAQQQAVRGTFDPMYLSYTLGKLMIVKLRADYQKKKGVAFSLGEFHDELLRYGAVPIPLIRRAMLGPDAGPAL